MIVTTEILEKGLSSNGAWNIPQLKALLPEREFERKKGTFPDKGWKSRIIGAHVTKEQINEFLRLKDKAQLIMF